MHKVGKIGEDIADKCLKQKGYTVITRNYRKPWGEIDIVGRSPDGTLVFFEVKTMKEQRSGLVPEDNLTSAKLQKLRKVCEEFAITNRGLIREKKGWRIDLLAVELPAEEILTEDINCDRIKHYENI